MTFNWDVSRYATFSNLQAEPGYLLMDALHLQSCERVLDLGCGIGNLTFDLASRCREGFVLGIDASASMINQAQTRAKGISNIEFRVLDATQIEFQQEFDAVFSNSTLHWILEGEKILTDIKKALKPGGRIGLQFPLLNDQHPLIAHAQKVIHLLHHESYY